MSQGYLLSHIQAQLPKNRVVLDWVQWGPFWVEVLISRQEIGDQVIARLYCLPDAFHQPFFNLWENERYQFDVPPSEGLLPLQGLQTLGPFPCALFPVPPGMPLNRLLQWTGPLKGPRAAAIAFQLLRCLEELYGSGLGHFDLTPEQLWLSDDDRVLLRSGGLFEFERQVLHTLSPIALESATFATPDHFASTPALTLQTDLYGVGNLLYFWLTGKTPFEGSFQEVRQQHLQKLPTNPKALKADISPGLAQVLAHLLAKQKNQRFATTHDVREALLLTLHPEQALLVQQGASQELPYSDHTLPEPPDSAQPLDDTLLRDIRQQLSSLVTQGQRSHAWLTWAQKLCKNNIHDNTPPPPSAKELARRANEILTDAPFFDSALKWLNTALNAPWPPAIVTRRALSVDVLEEFSAQTALPPLHRALFCWQLLEQFPHHTELQRYWSKVCQELGPELSMDTPRPAPVANEDVDTTRPLSAILSEPSASELDDMVDFSLEEEPVTQAPPIEVQDQELLESLSLEFEVAMQQQNFALAKTALARLLERFPGDPLGVDWQKRLESAAPPPPPPKPEQAPAPPEPKKPPLVPNQNELLHWREAMALAFKTNNLTKVRELLDRAPEHLPADQRATAEQLLEQAKEKENEKQWRLAELEAAIKKGNQKTATQLFKAMVDHFGEAFDHASYRERIANLPGESMPPATPKTSTSSDTPPQDSVPKTQKRLFLVAAAVVIIVIAAGAAFWFNRQKKQTALLAQYQVAQQQKENNRWEEALETYVAILNQDPGFRDTAKQHSELKQALVNRTSRIQQWLIEARQLKEGGFDIDAGQQNATAKARLILKETPGHVEAIALLKEMKQERLTLASTALAEGDLAKAKEEITQAQAIFDDEEGMELANTIKNRLRDETLTPVLKEVQALLERKQWEKAREITDTYEDEFGTTPELNRLWQEVTDQYQTRLDQAETSRAKLNILDVLTKIQPKDDTLIALRDSLNLELNQNRILALSEQMERQWKNGNTFEAATTAKELLTLDSKNEAAQNRLFDVIGTLRREADDLSQRKPSEAISRYEQILKLDNMKRYRTAITQLRGRLSLLDAEYRKLQQALNGGDVPLLKTMIDRQRSELNDMREEDRYLEMAKVTAALNRELPLYDDLVQWEANAQSNPSLPYRDIYNQLRQKDTFTLPFLKAKVQRLLSKIQEQIDQYRGPFRLVIRRAENLPKIKEMGGKPDAYVLLTLGGQQCQTDPVDNSFAPRWDHTCNFEASEAGTLMVLSVLDYNRLGKPLELGQVSLETIPETAKNMGVTHPEQGWTIILDISRQR